MGVLALDLGGSHVGCAVVKSGRVLASSRFETDAHSMSDLLPPIKAELLRCCDQAGIEPRTCRGIGVGIPSLIDGLTGEILSAFNKFPDLNANVLKAWCRSEFNLPLRIENDAALALIGEHYAGAAKGIGDVVMVTLGTGIGVATMLRHRLLRSHLGHAGSLGGHFVVRFDGRSCACGGVGCAEAEASTSVLPEIAAGWSGFDRSALAGEQPLNFAKLFLAADRGDVVSQEIIKHSIDVWSALAVTLVHAYGPQLMLFGGGIMQRGQEILTPIRSFVHQNAWQSSRGITRIEAAALGDQTAFIGAEALFDEGYE